jgi:hypothetical protein
MRIRGKHVLRLASWVLLATTAGAVGFAVRHAVVASARLPDGPVELVWDKAACAACGMHVGEPAFAAQLTTKDGHTLAFDDPGCCFLYVEEHRPDIHAMWFHHHREPRWLSRHAVAFARVEVTPMGFGIAAVEAGAREALDYSAARQLCLERTSGHETP